jgi:hypothetical protein
MFDEHAPLLERALVEQDFEPFAGRQFTFGVLCFDATLAPADTGGIAMALEPI